jgi:type II secretory pathway pseudopilin PulG
MISTRKAFTLVELLIFLGIFAFASAAFITVLLTVTRVQVRQASVADVSEQSQFLLQQIQYYIEGSSLVDIPQDTPTSTLKLWTGVAAQDPTYITIASGTVYLEQTATGTLQALTSNKVTVSNLIFTRRANVPSHDSVSISFTLAYNTINIEQAFSQMLQTSIARVSAATFDSNVLPSTSTSLNLGLSGQTWGSINQNIYFSGTNVGIGNPSPSYVLDVTGSFRVTAGSTFSGNVGIGTTSPRALLEVAGKTILSSSNARLSLQRTDGVNYLEYNPANNFIIRSINADDSSSTNRLTIATSGNVGIGTTATTMLEVNGTTTIDVGGSANHLVCWGSNGKTLGYCTGGVATSTGACTCSN